MWSLWGTCSWRRLCNANFSVARCCRYEHILHYVREETLRDRYGAGFTAILVKNVLPVPLYASKLRLRTATALLEEYMALASSRQRWDGSGSSEASPTKALVALITLMPSLVLEKIMKGNLRDKLEAFWPECLEERLRDPASADWQAVADILACLVPFYGEMALESRSSAVIFAKILKKRIGGLLVTAGGAQIAAVRENLVELLRLIARVFFLHPEAGKATPLPFAAVLEKHAVDLRPRLRPRGMELPYVLRAYLDLMVQLLRMGVGGDKGDPDLPPESRSQRPLGLHQIWTTVLQKLAAHDPATRTIALQILTSFFEASPPLTWPCWCGRKVITALASVVDECTATQLAWACRCLRAACRTEIVDLPEIWKKLLKTVLAKLNDRNFITDDFREPALLLLARLLDAFPSLLGDSVLFSLPIFRPGSIPTQGSCDLLRAAVKRTPPTREQAVLLVKWCLTSVGRTEPLAPPQWYGVDFSFAFLIDLPSCPSSRSPAYTRHAPRHLCELTLCTLAATVPGPAWIVWCDWWSRRRKRFKQQPAPANPWNLHCHHNLSSSSSSKSSVWRRLRMSCRCVSSRSNPKTLLPATKSPWTTPDWQ